MKYKTYNTICHKTLNRTDQHGRSIIEMLGVLAIVGILSIAGFFLFSKAMEKYKIDKAKEQLHTISSNIIMFYNKGTGYKGLNNETAQKLGLIPENISSFLD